MAKLDVTWTNEDTANLFDEDGHHVANLHWHNFIADWGVSDPKEKHEEIRWLRVDPSASEQAMEEHSKVLSQPESVRAPLEAELSGRLKMIRDDTRRMAEIGAKAIARRWVS